MYFPILSRTFSKQKEPVKNFLTHIINEGLKPLKSMVLLIIDRNEYRNVLLFLW